MTARARQTKKRTRIQALNETRILDAALNVFAAHGFRGSTIDAIAASADMSKPNLLYYFRSKEDIYVAVLRHTLDAWLEPLTALDPRGEPMSEIRNYITRKLDLSRTSPKASRLFANELLHGAPMIRTVLEGPLRELVDEKAAVLQHWIDTGRLAPIDPHHLIFMIWSTTQTYADFDTQMRAILGDKTADQKHFTTAADTLARVFFDGLKP
ncbi:MAG: TetR family transcriptional regulator C-terminal domain-containing protein [Alphaproteobacteria bacterium]